MNLSTLTFDERARLAYAEGYTETAELLAEMADLQAERDALQDKLWEEESRAEDLEKELKSAKEEIEALNDANLEAREELAQWRADHVANP